MNTGKTCAMRKEKKIEPYQFHKFTKKVVVPYRKLGRESRERGEKFDPNATSERRLRDDAWKGQPELIS